MADGTAQKCGRVGSCHDHLLNPFRKLEGFFSFLYIPDEPLSANDTASATADWRVGSCFDYLLNPFRKLKRFFVL